MSHILEYLIPGVADGAIYALAALGLVITYKTSGVFNFAHGAVAAVGAYAFYQLADRNHIAWPLAALITLVIVGVGVGLLLERVAAWLTAAPPVSIVVATVGILVALEGLTTVCYGASPLALTPFLPQSGPKVSDVTVSGQDFIQVGLALGAAVGLYFFFGRTRLGAAMSAVVDDPDLLGLQGIDPSKVRRVAWLIGMTFAGISGILLATELGVTLDGLVLLAIASFGAAAIGRFSSLPATFVGAIGMGIVIDYVPSLVQHITSPAAQELNENVPFLVLFAVLVFTPPRFFPELGSRVVRRFRPIKQYDRRLITTLLVLGLAGLIILPNVVNAADIDTYSAGLGYVIIFASLGLITWFSGQISLCQIAFAAVGAATLGHAEQAHIPFLLALLLAGLVNLPVAAIVAIPANRLSGIYVAVLTFGFGILIQQIFFQTFLMFGVLNYTTVSRPHIFGVSFAGDKAYYYLALTVAILCCLLVLLIRRIRLGRLLSALSDSPVALDAHGANTKVVRVTVFCISAALAGIGGGIVAMVSQQASGAEGGTFDYTVSLAFVAVLAICGRRPVLSPFIAAFLYSVINIYPFFTRPVVQNYEDVAFGVFAIVVAVAPGINTGAIGKRTYERDGVGKQVNDRLRPLGGSLPIQPAGVGAMSYRGNGHAALATEGANGNGRGNGNGGGAGPIQPQPRPTRARSRTGAS